MPLVRALDQPLLDDAERSPLLGYGVHLTSPFGREDVNLALTDALDLADALTSGRR